MRILDNDHLSILYFTILLPRVLLVQYISHVILLAMATNAVFGFMVLLRKRTVLSSAYSMSAIVTKFPNFCTKDIFLSLATDHPSHFFWNIQFLGIFFDMKSLLEITLMPHMMSQINILFLRALNIKRNIVCT